jgi:hypothetical protein
MCQFKYFGTTVTNHNLIEDEIKRKLISDNACYHSVQNLLPSRLHSKSLKIRIRNTISLPLVLYGRETFSLTLREEQTRGAWEQGAEENIRTEEGWSEKKVEKTA